MSVPAQIMTLRGQTPELGSISYNTFKDYSPHNPVYVRKTYADFGNVADPNLYPVMLISENGEYLDEAYLPAPLAKRLAPHLWFLIRGTLPDIKEMQLKRFGSIKYYDLNGQIGELLTVA